MLVLNSFKSQPVKRLKIADLQTITDLPRRTIQYALKTLLEKGFYIGWGKALVFATSMSFDKSD